jgi:hypothetical protein
MSVRRAWIRLPDYLLAFWALMWLAPGMVLGAPSALLCFALLYFDAKLSHMGANVDWQALNLHCHMDYG